MLYAHKYERAASELLLIKDTIAPGSERRRLFRLGMEMGLTPAENAMLLVDQLRDRIRDACLEGLLRSPGEICDRRAFDAMERQGHMDYGNVINAAERLEAAGLGLKLGV